jgi:hypothetical protein
MNWLASAGAVMLPLVANACQPEEQGRATAQASVVEPKADRYLDERYRLLTPDRLPNDGEVAAGCSSATSDAIRELEESGAIVDPSLDEFVVRKLECRWASDEPKIAACRFQQASIPFQTTPIRDATEAEAEKRKQIARLPDRSWTSAAARFALVAWVDPRIRSEPRWIATDTCQPFVWRGEGWEIDLREMARRRRQAN